MKILKDPNTKQENDKKVLTRVILLKNKICRE